MAEEELELDEAQELAEDELEDVPALEPNLGATPKTKSNLQLFIIGGVAFLLVVGGLLFYFSGNDTNKNKNSSNEAIMIDKNKEKEKKKKKKVKYFTLFTGLPISDTSKILKELSIHNITFQIDKALPSHSSTQGHLPYGHNHTTTHLKDQIHP